MKKCIKNMMSSLFGEDKKSNINESHLTKKVCDSDGNTQLEAETNDSSNDIDDESLFQAINLSKLFVLFIKNKFQQTYETISKKPLNIYDKKSVDMKYLGDDYIDHYQESIRSYLEEVLGIKSKDLKEVTSLFIEIFKKQIESGLQNPIRFKDILNILVDILSLSRIDEYNNSDLGRIFVKDQQMMDSSKPPMSLFEKTIGSPLNFPRSIGVEYPENGLTTSAELTKWFTTDEGVVAYAGKCGVMYFSKSGKKIDVPEKVKISRSSILLEKVSFNYYFENKSKLIGLFSNGPRLVPKIVDGAILLLHVNKYLSKKKYDQNYVDSVFPLKATTIYIEFGKDIGFDSNVSFKNVEVSALKITLDNSSTDFATTFKKIGDLTFNSCGSGLSDLTKFKDLDVEDLRLVFCNSLTSLVGCPKNIKNLTVAYLANLLHIDGIPLTKKIVLYTDSSTSKNDFFVVVPQATKKKSIGHEVKVFNNIVDELLSGKDIKTFSPNISRYISSDKCFVHQPKFKDGKKPQVTKAEKLLAPNGKPTKLSKEQYYMVRSKAFKNWFGDWENDPENASKMLDENGEPAIFYHGSASWNPFRDYNMDDIQFIEYGTFQAHKDKFFEQLKQFKDDTIFLFDEKDKVNAKEYANWQAHGSRIEAGGKLGSKDFRGSILQVFVNARNPLRVDFGGLSYSEYNGDNELVKQLQDIGAGILDELVLFGLRNPLTHINGLGRILKRVKLMVDKNQFDAVVDLEKLRAAIDTVVTLPSFILKKRKEYESSVEALNTLDRLEKAASTTSSDNLNSVFKKLLDNNDDRDRADLSLKRPYLGSLANYDSIIQAIEKEIRDFTTTLKCINKPSCISASKETGDEEKLKDVIRLINYHIELLNVFLVDIRKARVEFEKKCLSIIDQFYNRGLRVLKFLALKLSLYDMFIGYNLIDMGKNQLQTQYVALNPNLVKSATKNKGTFSTTSDNIMDSEDL